MAWPCISRACCIARFWNQLDKADIAVPLVFTKYSEATELPGTQAVFQQQQQQHQPARPLPSAIDIQPAGLSSDYHTRPSSAVDHGPAAPPGPSSRAPKETPMADSVMREDFKAWKVQGPEPSCKPKNEFQPSDQPFANQSQYQKDYRPWPIPRRGDHPWIPKQMAIPAVELDKGTKEPRSSSWERRSKSQLGFDRSEQKKEKEEAAAAKPAPEEKSIKTKKKAQQPEDQARPPHQQPGPSGTQEGGKGRAVVDALNRQIKEEVTARVSTSCYRNEFRPWTDIRPVRAIKAKSQYEPPDEKIFHQTSYSSQFTAEGAKPGPPDNKYMERRRIRTLYKEPLQESPKVEKPSPQPPKPKKTTPSHKSVKKPKDKQMASSRASKKKSAETPTRTATAEDKEKSKEINNKLAEAKE